MNTSIKMSNYEMDLDSTLDSMEEEYGDEIMESGWNPDVDLLRQQLLLEPVSHDMSRDGDRAMVISELFMRRMYSYHH